MKWIPLGFGVLSIACVAPVGTADFEAKSGLCQRIPTHADGVTGNNVDRNGKALDRDGTADYRVELGRLLQSPPGIEVSVIDEDHGEDSIAALGWLIDYDDPVGETVVPLDDVDLARVESLPVTLNFGQARVDFTIHFDCNPQPLGVPTRTYSDEQCDGNVVLT